MIVERTSIVSYNGDMTAEQFRLTLHSEPFRPFTIRMADG
jgi:hypothetical protein